MIIQSEKYLVIICIIPVACQIIQKCLRIIAEFIHILDRFLTDCLHIRHGHRVNHLVAHPLHIAKFGCVSGFDNSEMRAVFFDPLSPVIKTNVKLKPFTGVISGDQLNIFCFDFPAEHIREFPGVIIDVMLFAVMAEEFLNVRPEGRCLKKMLPE